MSNINGIPNVATGRRSTLGIQRQSIAPSPNCTSSVIASLREELKVATAKIALQDVQIKAQEQRIAALEALFLPSGNGSVGVSAGTGAPRKQRDPEVSREVRATFKEYQRENNGIGVLIASNTSEAIEFNQNAKRKMAATSESVESYAMANGTPTMGLVVKKRGKDRADQHLKYQKAKARRALKPPEVVLAFRHSNKLSSRRSAKRDRRHKALVADPQKCMRLIGENDANVCFDVVNKLLLSPSMMSDEEDEAGAGRDIRRLVRIRPAYRSQEFNELCELLDADYAAKGNVLEHSIGSTEIDSDKNPRKNFKGIFYRWGFTSEAWSSDS